LSGSKYKVVHRMEAIISRRLCRVCLGQLLSARNSSYQTLSTSLHKPSPKGYQQLKSRSLASRQYSAETPKKTVKTVQGKINLADTVEKDSGGTKIPWIAIGVGSAFIALYGALRYRKSQAERELLEKQPLPMVKLSVGGPWELVNHDGQTMTEQDFRGQWVLYYFGFTHCPDICPDEVEKIVKAVNIVDNNKEIPNVKPLFITVDEDRDTKEVIKSYLAEFSPKFMGFTGTPEQIATIKKAYRVYSSKGPVDADNDYIVDHSIITYLVNPDGDTVMYFARDADMLDVARRIEKAMKLYQRLKS